MRAWQVFCSEKCRKEASRQTRSVEYSCVYCGLLADSVDHVPPRSVRQTLVDLGIAGRYPFVEVRCCRQCNSALGDRSLWTVLQRKAWIKKWLRRHYQKYLNIPDWTELELARLGADLRQHTEHGLAVRALIRYRLAY